VKFSRLAIFVKNGRRKRETVRIDAQNVGLRQFLISKIKKITGEYVVKHTRKLV
jgi:hypothetical protein